MADDNKNEAVEEQEGAAADVNSKETGAGPGAVEGRKTGCPVRQENVLSFRKNLVRRGRFAASSWVVIMG